MRDMALRFTTAGESHGPALVGILEGVPRGIAFDFDFVARELERRRHGYGRSGRQKIEDDAFEVEAGVRHGRTTGAPIAIRIVNRDHAAWGTAMSAREVSEACEAFTKPRPGHADLAGGMKFRTHDLRDIVERASARETAMRVALGAVAKMLLRDACGTFVASAVTQIHDVVAPSLDAITPGSLESIDLDANRCVDGEVSAKMSDAIKRASHAGTTVGGLFEVHASPVLVGLGSHVQWHTRLDARLAAALMSIPGVKAVEIGAGRGYASATGAEMHDEIVIDAGVISRATNRAGGIEGGMSNGEPVVVRAAMKPLPTQRKPLASVDLRSRGSAPAAHERSDVCAVAPASVVGEAKVALVIAEALLEKFGGDSMEELSERVAAHRAAVERY